MGVLNTLLIIDDNEILLNAIDDYFSKRNYKVYASTNGLDALKLLETHGEAIDLIITDLIMPNISGVGIISIAKKKYPKIPVIAITGWGEHPEALAAEANADKIIEKPIKLNKLEDVIKDMLAQKNLNK
ncbi:MAG: response regulator [Proteobacteria bacterium]|nr:response regulator [Pseudomonadota bacterium]